MSPVFFINLTLSIMIIVLKIAKRTPFFLAKYEITIFFICP